MSVRTDEKGRAAMSKALKPGTAAPRSGQYRNNTTKTEVTGVRGKPLPPTPGAGQSYSLVDPTKHKRQQ
jgi:hypothetical protein